MCIRDSTRGAPPRARSRPGPSVDRAARASGRREPDLASGVRDGVVRHADDGSWLVVHRGAIRVAVNLSAGPTPGWGGGKKAAKARLATRGKQMSELQERLFANGRTGGTLSVLLVLQGLDTAGKGGIVRHVLGMVDPQGVALRSFGVPTAVEAAHNYLWRIRNALPRPGYIGVFDRSHYE